MAESIKIPIEIVDQFGKPLAYLNSSLGGAYKSVEKVNSASRRMSRRLTHKIGRLPN